ncbi:unnamed protein product [Periconia digitata]|uniref:Uncharacterized protein n=1 Tax=Periconia digitata TaxID=1303443 RepID=A0A9W4USB7_9PLEO|nr:unnamed protein product [Periconia digitata]
MPLLPDIKAQHIRTGRWQDLTAPWYQQHLWTTTNVEAVIVIGLLGILGAIAGDATWPILRHYLQPAVQLPDPESRRNKLSRADAINALWVRLRLMMRSLEDGMNHSNRFIEKTRIILSIIKGNHRQAPADSDIGLRFGVFAIISTAAFLVLGILIPFFLGEGLQGQAAVQALQVYHSEYLQAGWSAIYNERVWAQVEEDMKTCVKYRIGWKNTQHCMGIRDNLPLYRVENLSLMDPRLNHSTYRLLLENGNANFTALRVSRNTSFQDISFNRRKDAKKILHELTCLPMDLDPYIKKSNGTYKKFDHSGRPSVVEHGDTYNLNVDCIKPARKPTQHEVNPDGPKPTTHWSMILRTSNAIGSYSQLVKEYMEHNYAQTITRLKNVGRDGATWYQTTVDAVLPWVAFSGPEYVYPSFKHELMPLYELLEVLEGFIFTIKSAQRFYESWPLYEYKDPIWVPNDPLSRAHISDDLIHFTDREVSALICTEIFKTCERNECREPYPRPEFVSPSDNYEQEEWLERYFLGIMSVWMDTSMGSIYTVYRTSYEYIEKEGGRRWQEDVEERFIRSMLRVLHGSRYMAEQAVYKRSPNPSDPPIPSPLLYGNSGYTNINILGYAATLFGYLYIIASSYWLVLFWPLAHPIKFTVLVAGLCVRMYHRVIEYWGNANIQFVGRIR